MNVIYLLRITVGFQLNRSSLENKRTEAIVFFTNFHKNNDGRKGKLLRVAKQGQRR